MRILVLFLFLAYPMLELALMIKVGSAIGLWALMLLIVATGVLGVVVLREHGIATLRRIAEAMTEGRLPIEPVFNGALLGTAGMLLIAPGLITDALGLLLLLPPVRHELFKLASKSFAFETAGLDGRDAGRAGPGEQPTAGPSRQGRQSDSFGRPRQPHRDPIVIEGEYERIDEHDPKPPGTPGHVPRER